MHAGHQPKPFPPAAHTISPNLDVYEGGRADTRLSSPSSSLMEWSCLQLSWLFAFDFTK